MTALRFFLYRGRRTATSYQLPVKWGFRGKKNDSVSDYVPIPYFGSALTEAAGTIRDIKFCCKSTAGTKYHGLRLFIEPLQKFF